METSADTLTAERIEEILAIHFEYYKNLKPEEKPKFVERTLAFIKLKEFLPRGSIDITAGIDDIKTLISAAAIQLTFGLSEFRLDKFSKIFIYPREYYNGFTKHYNKGEANVAGALVFSWKDFKAGYDDSTDKINLGLHEMGHALMLNRAVGNDNDLFFVKYFDKWWSVSQSEFKKLQQHETSMFRNYGGTNSNEFFAVCMETFFEGAKEFKEKHPEIYRQTCILLNQDPSGTYTYTSSVRAMLLNNKPANLVPQNLQYRTQGKSWTGTIILSVIFAGWIGFTAYSTGFNQITLLALLILIAVLAIKYVWQYEEFFFYDNAFAIGYERRGKDTGEQIVFYPDWVLSVYFLPGGKNTPPYVVIDYIEAGELKEHKWPYGHLSIKDSAGLETNMLAFCKVHNIAFKNN